MTQRTLPEAATAVSGQSSGVLLARIAGGTPSNPAQPWGGAAAVGPERWTATLPWTVSGGGGTQNLLNRIELAVEAGVPTDWSVWRVEYVLDAVKPTSGFGALSFTVAAANFAGGVAGDSLQTLLWISADTPSTTGHASAFEIQVPPLVGAGFLDFRLLADNIAPDGSITITSLSVRQVDRLRRYINVGNAGVGGPVAGSVCYIDLPTTDAAGTEVRARQELRTEGDLPASVFSLTTIAEADSLYPTGLVHNFPDEIAPLHLNNSDQIFLAYKDDDSTEYLANTHGGETGQTGVDADDFQILYDIGDGTWRLLTDYIYGHRARRVKFICNSKVTRTDAGTPFANVDHIWTFFDDGTIRCDRTTTFLQDQKLAQYIYWMTSYPTTSELVGRMGNGETAPIGSVDYTGEVNDDTASSEAQWALYLEPISGIVFGHLLDQENASSLPGAVAARVWMLRAAGLEKIYTLLEMESGMPHTVPAGSEFVSTLWHVVYQPELPTEWHREGSIKGAAVQSLGQLYPVE